MRAHVECEAVGKIWGIDVSEKGIVRREKLENHEVGSEDGRQGEMLPDFSRFMLSCRSTNWKLR